MLSLLFGNLLFANNNIQKALEFEKRGQYKEAMKLYKAELVESKRELLKAINGDKSNGCPSNSVDNYVLDNSKLKDYSSNNLSSNQANKVLDEKETSDRESNKVETNIVKDDLMDRKLSKDKKTINKEFEIYTKKENYIMPIVRDLNGDKNNKSNNETEFQLSFSKPVFTNLLGHDEQLSVAYTQKTTWQTFEKSAPMRETMYNPELYLTVPLKNNFYMDELNVGLEHKSNGRGGKLSRSWNNAYMEPIFNFGDLEVRTKLWATINEDNDKLKVTDYLGHGSLNLRYSLDDHLFDLKLMNNFKSKNNKQTTSFTYSYPIPYLGVYGFINWYNGYGHTMIDLDKKVNRVGFGIAISR